MSPGPSEEDPWLLIIKKYLAIYELLTPTPMTKKIFKDFLLFSGGRLK
jgi:hypothetical protein